MRELHIKRFSRGSIAIASILLILFVVISAYGLRNFKIMDDATEQYLACEKSAEGLQHGSDVLTEQVRLYVMTGNRQYMDGYFTEADVTKSRERAVDELERYFENTQIITELEEAMSGSEALMDTEIYAMRLASEEFGLRTEELPVKVAKAVLTPEDNSLDNGQKLIKARSMVCDDFYQSAKISITENVNRCLNDIAMHTRQLQRKTVHQFKNLYVAQGVVFLLIVAFFIANSAVISRMITKPLVSYNESIKNDESVPVIGAVELQSLAKTYNEVLEENRRVRRNIRHKAEHDALSDLLNKGSFDELMAVYEQSGTPFALIFADIDEFKAVNDNYGHAVGDEIIKRVASLLMLSFRSSDYVFRVGGDEFAVIMTDVSEKCKRIVEGKLDTLKKELAASEGNFPSVTMSIGVAFSDRLNPGESIFEDADKALYYVKKHGKNGSCFYDGTNIK